MLTTYTLLLRNDIAEWKQREELLIEESANDVEVWSG